MSARMYDLAWEIDGDNIRLTQDNGCGELSVVDLHTSQFRLLAESAGLLAPAGALPGGFRRRLLRLQSDVGYLAGDCWLDEICERLGNGLAFKIGMTFALDTINDLLIDAGITPDTDDACKSPPDPLGASPLSGCLPSIAGAAGAPSLFD